jgi:hypothetical protein
MWSRTPWQKRVELLRKAASLIEERIFELGAAMALEVGKNRMESLGDVQETADLIYYSCYQMEKNEGFIVEMGKDPLVGYEARNVSVLRPYGVWLIVSPFNFPHALTGGPIRRGARHWQYARRQTRHRYRMDRAPAGGLLPRCGHTRWRGELRHGSWFHAWSGAGGQPRSGRRDLHRLLRCGHENVPGFRQA